MLVTTCQIIEDQGVGLAVALSPGIIIIIITVTRFLEGVCIWVF